LGIGSSLRALERNPSALEVALYAKPAAVLSFGDPAPYTDRIREAGCKIIRQVQTLTLSSEAAPAASVAQRRLASGKHRQLVHSRYLFS
jgi:nitronate monooxygenase